MIGSFLSKTIVPHASIRAFCGAFVLTHTLYFTYPSPQCVFLSFGGRMPATASSGKLSYVVSSQMRIVQTRLAPSSSTLDLTRYPLSTAMPIDVVPGFLPTNPRSMRLPIAISPSSSGVQSRFGSFGSVTRMICAAAVAFVTFSKSIVYSSRSPRLT